MTLAVPPSVIAVRRVERALGADQVWWKQSTWCGSPNSDRVAHVLGSASDDAVRVLVVRMAMNAYDGPQTLARRMEATRRNPELFLGGSMEFDILPFLRILTVDPLLIRCAAHEMAASVNMTLLRRSSAPTILEMRYVRAIIA
jgi:hypothetical protein